MRDSSTCLHETFLANRSNGAVICADCGTPKAKIEAAIVQAYMRDHRLMIETLKRIREASTETTGGNIFLIAHEALESLEVKP